MVKRRAPAATEVTTPPETATTPLKSLSIVGKVPDVSPTSVSKSNGTAAKSVTALKDELEQATQREVLLHRQMRELEVQMASDRERIHALETELKDCQSLTAQLAQSEETIRQLAQANAKLSQELEALQAIAPPPAKTSTRALATRSLPAKAEPSAPVLDAHDALMQHQRQRLAHPIFPDAKLPAQMGDQDLGWFD
jgi:septal ring factor EnvC (AmiA/AmiB activator)